MESNAVVVTVRGTDSDALDRNRFWTCGKMTGPNTMTHTPEYWLSVAMDFSPVIPIAIAWTQVPKKDRSPTETTELSLLAATFSVLWLVVSVFVPQVLGPTGDWVRSLAADGNFVVITMAGARAVGKMRSGRIATAIGCFLLVVAWSWTS